MYPYDSLILDIERPAPINGHEQLVRPCRQLFIGAQKSWERGRSLRCQSSQNLCVLPIVHAHAVMAWTILAH